MSSETIPAPATSPSTTGNTPPGDGQVTPRKSAFAAFLAPVAPVATTTDDDTDSDAVGDGDDLGEQAAGGSSAEYKSDGASTDTSNDDNAIKNQKSIPRAFLLAMAQRWAKGGGTANKRLDVQKARAQARQIKTNKTVNGAGLSGLLGGGKSGGSSGSGKGADKGGASKKSAGGGRSGLSNSSSGRGNGSSGSGGRGPSGTGKSTNNGGGRSNTGGKGSSGTGGGRGGNSPKTGNNRSSSDKGLNKPRTKNDSGSGVNKTPKNVKTPGGLPGDRPWRNNKTSGGGKNNGPAGNGGGNKTPKTPTNKTPKNSKKNPASTQGPSGTGNTQPPKTNTTKTPKQTAGPNSQPVTKTTKTPRPWHRTPITPKQPKNGQGTGQPNTPPNKLLSLIKKPKPNPATNTPPNTNKPPAKPGPNGKTTPPVNLTKNPKQPRPNLLKPKKTPAGPTTAQQQPKPRRRTQTAREAGYRHGIAIGDLVAQTRAYGDGVKDGVHNRTEHGDREKREMDAIHARRKKQHEEKTMTTAAPEAPVQIPATRVGDTVHLGPGADRSTMTGGEVRNMKDFQDRLTVKTYSLQWKAEDLKSKKAKIADLAKRAVELAEKEKALATGGKSIAAVSRASAAISALDAVANELLVRLLRGIDETDAVKSNTETRYGQIYKAVVDNDEQAPANCLAYYRETEA